MRSWSRDANNGVRELARGEWKPSHDGVAMDRHAVVWIDEPSATLWSLPLSGGAAQKLLHIPGEEIPIGLQVHGSRYFWMQGDVLFRWKAGDKLPTKMARGVHGRTSWSRSRVESPLTRRAGASAPLLCSVDPVIDLAAVPEFAKRPTVA